MTRRDAALFGGAFVIGFMSQAVWREFWPTAFSLVIGVIAWYALIRTVDWQ